MLWPLPLSPSLSYEDSLLPTLSPGPMLTSRSYDRIISLSWSPSPRSTSPSLDTLENETGAGFIGHQPSFTSLALAITHISTSLSTCTRQLSLTYRRPAALSSILCYSIGFVRSSLPSRPAGALLCLARGQSFGVNYS